MGRKKGTRYTTALLLGHRPNEDAARDRITGYMPPRTLGSHTSLLAAMLSRGKVKMADPAKEQLTKEWREKHADIRLTEAEFVRVVNWIDTNCQYHPFYWGLKNLKHRKDPRFRPHLPFDEATGSEYPETLLKATPK